MVKKELNNLYHLNKEINELLEEIMREEAKAQKVTGTLSDMPRGSETSDKVGNGACRITALKELLD